MIGSSIRSHIWLSILDFFSCSDHGYTTRKCDQISLLVRIFVRPLVESETLACEQALHLGDRSIVKSTCASVTKEETRERASPLACAFLRGSFHSPTDGQLVRRLAKHLNTHLP